MLAPFLCLRLLAAATAINVKRLRNAKTGAPWTANPDGHAHRPVTGLLLRVLDAIGHAAVADGSTGSGRGAQRNRTEVRLRNRLRAPMCLMRAHAWPTDAAASRPTRKGR